MSATDSEREQIRREAFEEGVRWLFNNVPAHIILASYPDHTVWEAFSAHFLPPRTITLRRWEHQNNRNKSEWWPAELQPNETFWRDTGETVTGTVERG